MTQLSPQAARIVEQAAADYQTTGNPAPFFAALGEVANTGTPNDAKVILDNVLNSVTITNS